MRDPAVEALAFLKTMLSEHCQDSMEQPKTDLFGHGKQVGEYVGLQRAIAILQNAMSSRDLEDAKL